MFNNKLPSSILHELCVKKDIIERYEVISVTGPPNDPVFTMLVETNSGLRAEGKGKKKKEAQHNAAQALLDKMDHSNSSYKNNSSSNSSPTRSCSSSTSSSPWPSLSPSVHDTVSNEVSSPDIGNAVGQLQEYCAKRGLQWPNYQMEHRVGKDHQPIFTMKCVLGEEYSTGTARTKQQAKQEAARVLYEKLMSLPEPLFPPDINGPNETLPVFPAYGEQVRPQLQPQAPPLTQEEKDDIIKAYSLCKPLTSIPKTNPYLKFSKYHSSMVELFAEVKNDLVESTSGPPRETLKNLVSKLNLFLSFHEGRDITELDTRSGKCSVYAVVNTQPLTVQIGQGQSTTTAEIDAARNVLLYWQSIMGIV